MGRESFARRSDDNLLCASRLNHDADEHVRSWYGRR